MPNYCTNGNNHYHVSKGSMNDAHNNDRTQDFALKTDLEDANMVYDGLTPAERRKRNSQARLQQEIQDRQNKR